MLEGCLGFMRNRANPAKQVIAAWLFAVLGAVGSEAIADPRVDRNFLPLPDGRWIWLKKVDDWSTRIIVGKGKPKSENGVLWSKTYEDDDDRTWAYAYFAWLNPSKLVLDLDGDGAPEVGIATYDMGTLMVRPILIFSIRGNELVPLRETGPINLSTDESVFK
jgi:hypothetical protein